MTDVKRSARSFEQLGLEHYEAGDVEGAVHFFEKALIEDRKVYNLPGISQDLVNIARCYTSLELYENAEKILGEAREIGARSGDPNGLADTHLALAQIRIRQNEYDEAGALLDEAMTLYSKARNDRGTANVLNAKGSLAMKDARYDQAYSYYKEAESAFKRMDKSDWRQQHAGLAVTYTNLGYLFELQGKGKEAADYYLLALGEDTFLENSVGISSGLHNLARLYKATGDYENALFYYKRALDTNRALLLPDRIRQDLESIVDLLGTMGREEERAVYEKALGELSGAPGGRRG